MEELLHIMRDRSLTYISSENKPIYISDELAFIFNEYKNRCDRICETTTNGAEYTHCAAMSEFLGKLTKGTIVDL